MPRRNRCIIPDVAYHITQRGVDGRETFSSAEDRLTYLKLVARNLPEAQVRLLAWCLMSNHVHLIAIPAQEDSLAVLLRRVHGRYSQYYNACRDRRGHLWQNRYYDCVLSWSHLWRALGYVERNPVRAGLVNRAEDYRWSSAAAHVRGRDETGVLDMKWWKEERLGVGKEWADALAVDNCEDTETLRQCTHSGKPFGDEFFVREFGEKFGRQWKKGRPRKMSAQLLLLPSCAENGGRSG